MLTPKRRDIVNCIDKADNLALELVKINALVTIECMDELVCDDFDCGFHLRFIFRSTRAGRKSCSVVVLQELFVGVMLDKQSCHLQTGTI